MRALVTGATGKVGHATVRALLADGHEVRALVRDPARAAPLVPGGVELVRGDVTEAASLEPAARGCEVVFNAMGLPEQWLPDPGRFEQVNVAGTVNVVRAAARAGARRVVHTSTIDVFETDANGRLTEERLATAPKGTAYERSKQRAETEALRAAGGDLEVVMVNPCAVYGPGPRGSASLEAAIFEPVAAGNRLRTPFLPPGGLGLVFSEGIGAGQLAAASRGTAGERYILCDEHVTLRELAEAVVRVAGRGRVPPSLPAPVAKAFAGVGETVARLTGRPPLLARGELHFLLWNARPDASKARRELGWRPTPLDDGLRRTLNG